ncbi:hypothetical protein [Pseudolactococcus reticulitermitis]|uniref:Uncharacterized protein n=1 Tax=Pseudolactococcus reticulitermitis TaxID=2025039 RepID=A0A224X0R4_9LACT|nr:hypothetical protein [Lactococcus reticulitermitis]GAX47808.1 hypothetical protein RsY01_1412 [Lactococcus reticulitermitis]
MDKTYIQDIIGQKFSTIGRAADMAWLGFGKEVQATDWKGRDRIVHEFALHLQTSWRIIDNQSDRIVIASGDMYYPISDTDTNAKTFDWDTFDWDIQGGNLYDERAENMNLSENDSRVLDVTVNDHFDICITFSNGWCLQAFISRTQGEVWRFFEPTKGKDHFVAENIK